VGDFSYADSCWTLVIQLATTPRDLTPTVMVLKISTRPEEDQLINIHFWLTGNDLDTAAAADHFFHAQWSATALL
jgi:hypothetical protein